MLKPSQGMRTFGFAVLIAAATACQAGAQTFPNAPAA
jgi:hypothetical protein